jgi:hypothetical protein
MLFISGALADHYETRRPYLNDTTETIRQIVREELEKFHGHPGKRK